MRSNDVQGLKGIDSKPQTKLNMKYIIINEKLTLCTKQRSTYQQR